MTYLQICHVGGLSQVAGNAQLVDLDCSGHICRSIVQSLRHVGVMVVLQVEGTAASDIGAQEPPASLAGLGWIKLVLHIL